MSENELGPSGGEDRVLVPVSLGGRKVYLAVQQIGGPVDPGDEREIAARGPALVDVVAGLTDFVEQFSGRLQRTDASRVTLEFGCEFAVESGSFVAVIGKASARSTFKVGLEWTKPEQ
ncbi:CU044_2847 family protein [Longispora sp. NPDC051575]|uniref:CU044_2847 family protein n=1 Tax=Longispora sp. NPDC051575 TaxID=3154943 RepID=UPI00341D2096